MNSSNQNFEAMLLQDFALDLQNPLQTLTQISTTILLAFALALAICMVYRQTHQACNIPARSCLRWR